MKQKYYTPSLEEFYVGFEYEAQELTESGASVEWEKYKFEINDSLELLFKESDWYELPRVKYLDRQDIEELGWKHENGLVFKLPNKNYSLWWNFNSLLSNYITIRKKINDSLIDVVIAPCKNKSELKKLMKQLNII